MQVYNDELYHYGILGMKWGKHRAKVQAEKEKRKAEDKDILDARSKTGAALDNYNRKANYSNKDLTDKKAYKEADDALEYFLKLNSQASMKTHAEKGRATATKALLAIGTMTYVAGITYSMSMPRR